MHLMIDLETLCTKPTAVVLSAGLVLFDPKEGIKKKHHEVLDVQAQLDSGRTVSESTLKWWFSQGEKAKGIFDNLAGDNEVNSNLHISSFLSVLEGFLNGIDLKELKVWGNGPSFDLCMIENMYHEEQRWIPWKFWNVCCFRTFDRITKCRQKHQRKGTHHDALDDAVYQAECVIKSMGGKV